MDYPYADATELRDALQAILGGREAMDDYLSQHGLEALPFDDIPAVIAEHVLSADDEVMR